MSTVPKRLLHFNAAKGGSRYLALIGYSREPRFSQEKPTVDYNIELFGQALAQVLDVI